MSDEEKEEKPKKTFIVTHIIWDDGEVDTEMYEYRKNQSGRGAPGKWRLKGPEFLKRLEDQLGDPEGYVEIMTDNLGVTTTKPETPASVDEIPDIVEENEDKEVG